MSNYNKSHYKNGFIKGLPIGLGYLPVSFTFGLMATNAGIPVWITVFISMSNLTSSGQFAGTNLIIAHTSYFEITLTTLIINLRYLLMSLSLSQKIKKDTSLFHRLLFSFGITDEVFAIASAEPKELTPSYMYGLITLPFAGWTLGTLLGACTSGLLPESIKGAMGIALYAMFIAIIIPPAKQQRPIFITILLSVVITCIIRYIPCLHFISGGFCTIAATLISAAVVAYIAPVSEDKQEEEPS